MATIPLLLVFLGGLLLIFLTGRLIGHIIGLDKYFKDEAGQAVSVPYKTRNKKNRKIKADKGSPVNGADSQVRNMINTGQ